jgi:hypothetical protein
MKRTPMEFDLLLFMSDETHHQTLAAAANYDDGDDGCVRDGVETQPDLALTHAVVDAEIGADAASQTTTITQLTVTNVTGVEGYVYLPTRLEPQKMGSTPVRRGGVLFCAGGNEEDSVIQWKIPSTKRSMSLLGQGRCLCPVLTRMVTMRMMKIMTMVPLQVEKPI